MTDAQDSIRARLKEWTKLELWLLNRHTEEGWVEYQDAATLLRQQREALATERARANDPSPELATLLLTLREECEVQHARAEALSARLSAAEALIPKWRLEAAEEQRVSFCADQLEAALASTPETPK